MTFAKIPTKDGVPLVGTKWLHEGRSISETEAIAYFDGSPKEGWQPLSELEYLSYWEAGILSADKKLIIADGIDEAVITAVVEGLEEVKWYDADTGEMILSGEVDLETKSATLQITMSAPGVRHVRVGQPTATRLNEVVIVAK